VDFDFVGASEVYYEAVKVLLGGYLEDVGWDAHGAAEAVVGQTEVGTLVNSGEEEGNAIAMCTVLGLDGALGGGKGGADRKGKGKDGERNWRADVGRYLRQKVGKGAQPKVEAALGSRAGLLLLERLINAPVQLAPKLLELTLGEVSGGEYASFLMLSRAVQGAPSGSVGDALLDDSDGDDAGGMVSKKEASKAERQARKKEKKRQRREERQREEELLSYVRPEDVILEANAEWVERWAAHIPEGSGTGGFGQLRPGEKPVRALLCLSRRGLEAACAQLAQAFPEE